MYLIIRTPHTFLTTGQDRGGGALREGGTGEGQSVGGSQSGVHPWHCTPEPLAYHLSLLKTGTKGPYFS